MKRLVICAFLMSACQEYKESPTFSESFICEDSPTDKNESYTIRFSQVDLEAYVELNPLSVELFGTENYLYPKRKQGKLSATVLYEHARFDYRVMNHISLDTDPGVVFQRSTDGALIEKSATVNGEAEQLMYLSIWALDQDNELSPLGDPVIIETYQFNELVDIHYARDRDIFLVGVFDDRGDHTHLKKLYLGDAGCLRPR